MSLLDNVKQVSIIDFAERCGYAVRRIGNFYTLREHDSVRIDSRRNCFWRNSLYVRGQKGHSGTVIDFAIEFCNCRDAKEAMHYIANMYGITADTDYNYTNKKFNTNVRETRNTNTAYNQKKKTGKLCVPKAVSNTSDIINYLCDKRGVSRTVVDYFIDKGMLFQDERKNCVFISPDKKFGCIRSTGDIKFVRDLENCDYNECFYFSESTSPKSIIVAESVIDVMSVMTYAESNNWFLTQYKDKCYLALSGTNKITSLYYHLENNAEISDILLAMDKDKAGTTAVSNILKTLSERGYKGNVRFLYPPKGKDWNEYIQQKGMLSSG